MPEPNSSFSKLSSFYLHWPFCPYRCNFCPFVAMAGQDEFACVYNEALQREIEHFGKSFHDRLELKTLFLGGGTPSRWPVGMLLDTFDTLNSVLCFKASSEVTIEVNPGTIDKAAIGAWREVGVNRVSIGVQSDDDGALSVLGRRHTFADSRHAVENLAKDFDNISVDLILGLPGMLEKSWRRMVSEVVSWPVQHVSMYLLEVHEKTKIAYRLKKGELTLPDEQEVVKTYEWTVNELRASGFEQYELSNFSRPGYRSLHNQVYWDRLPYRGFGLGAASFDGRSRFRNDSNLLSYVSDCEKNGSAVTFHEDLTEEQVKLEKIMLGLRRPRGVPLSELLSGGSSGDRQRLMDKINLFKERGYLCTQDGGKSVAITPSALPVENELVANLIL